MQARRFERGDDGFTLIELMVVVLIIGILVSIAIPTFLSARTEAQNRAVESSLRNAMTTAQAIFVKDGYQFNTTTLPAELTSMEPALAFTQTTATPSGVSQNLISFYATTNDICLASLSGSGKTLEMSIVLDPTPGNGWSKGTYFYMGTGVVTCPTGIAYAGSNWASSASGAGW